MHLCLGILLLRNKGMEGENGECAKMCDKAWQSVQTVAAVDQAFNPNSPTSNPYSQEEIFTSSYKVAYSHILAFFALFLFLLKGESPITIAFRLTW